MKQAKLSTLLCISIAHQGALHGRRKVFDLHTQILPSHSELTHCMQMYALSCMHPGLEISPLVSRKKKKNNNHPQPSLLSTNFNSSLLILLKPALERYSWEWCYPMPFLSGFHSAKQSIQGSHCRLLVPVIASDMYSWKDSYSRNDLLF